MSAEFVQPEARPPALDQISINPGIQSAAGIDALALMREGAMSNKPPTVSLPIEFGAVGIDNGTSVDDSSRPISDGANPAAMFIGPVLRGVVKIGVQLAAWDLAEKYFNDLLEFLRRRGENKPVQQPSQDQKAEPKQVASP